MSMALQKEKKIRIVTGESRDQVQTICAVC